MNRNQANWASGHDWYHGSYTLECGAIAVLVRPDTGETVENKDRCTYDYFGKPAIVFTDFNELKVWAGY